MASNEIQGPPYYIDAAMPGGLPTPGLDLPVCIVLIFFYLGAAIGHMTIFQRNKRKVPKHDFKLSAVLFGFCMTRMMTLSLRAGWSTHQNNVSLSIAAAIFLNAGILILYLVNVAFALRIVRARHPDLGWHPLVRLATRVMILLVIVALFALIVFVVLEHYTLNRYLWTISRYIDAATMTYFLIVALVGPGLLILTLVLPTPLRTQSFGAGKGRDKMWLKMLVVAVIGFLSVLNAGYKAGVGWMSPKPASDFPWYDSKAILYCFFFAIEIIMIWFLLLVRVDQLFWVPDGSRKRMTYDVYESSGRGDDVRRSMVARSILFGSSGETVDSQKDKDKSKSDADLPFGTPQFEVPELQMPPVAISPLEIPRPMEP